ncbi:Uncharacterized protein HZ326_28363 [Fusarium oxysporum f. sp. albedinis]|nr:Uncharacterized protein HZ326_28363 [Fusarium oxysporum f. sp. albedinis]
MPHEPLKEERLMQIRRYARVQSEEFAITGMAWEDEKGPGAKLVELGPRKSLISEINGPTPIEVILQSAF